MHVGETFYDLTKAFDCINDEIFLAKLYFHGIREVSADCFRSYSIKRRQIVEINLPYATQNIFNVM
jgi:hypothetical protein